MVWKKDLPQSSQWLTWTSDTEEGGWSCLRGANRHLISTTQKLHKVIMCTSPRWPAHSSYTKCICQVSFNHRKKGSTSSLYKKQRWRKCKSLRFAGILRVAKKWCKVYVQMRDREALKQSATLSLLTQNTEHLAGLGKNSILASAHYYFHCQLICTERREQVEENLGRWRYALERRGLKVGRSMKDYVWLRGRQV